MLLKQRVSEPGLGRVLVVDGGGSLRVALLGDMVAGLAAANGWAGLVINGCVRDVAVLRHLPIGIKALASNPRPSGKAGAGEIDVPVEIGGITIRPGAQLASDDDGIVVLDAGLNDRNPIPAGAAASIGWWPSHRTRTCSRGSIRPSSRPSSTSTGRSSSSPARAPARRASSPTASRT